MSTTQMMITVTMMMPRTKRCLWGIRSTICRDASVLNWGFLKWPEQGDHPEVLRPSSLPVCAHSVLQCPCSHDRPHNHPHTRNFCFLSLGDFVWPESQTPGGLRAPFQIHICGSSEETIPPSKVQDGVCYGWNYVPLSPIHMLKSQLLVLQNRTFFEIRFLQRSPN